MPGYTKEKKVSKSLDTKIFLTNKVSATLIIPIEIARRKGLDHPSNVSVGEVPEGILIRKMVLVKAKNEKVKAGH
jgi:hypothetical protein